MTERQLIADLLSALEYHTEQTRPIEFSRVAIQAATEYLRKPEQTAQSNPLVDQLIRQRDHQEEIIDKLCDAVLGPDRSEWSSQYFFEDAVREVEERMAALEQPAQAIGNTVHLSLDQLAGLFPPPAEGCDFCNNPLYAGTVCKNCGRLAEQPAPVQQEPDQVKFERHWRKIRGEKKANRELPRHPLQPQTYIQDSANRHWVTWQAAVMSVAPPAQRKPLTEEEMADFLGCRYHTMSQSDLEFFRLGEAAHGIKGDA